MEKLQRVLMYITGHSFDLYRILYIDHPSQIPFDYIVVDVHETSIITKARTIPTDLLQLYSLTLSHVDAYGAMCYISNPTIKNNLAFFHVTHQSNCFSPYLKLVRTAFTDFTNVYQDPEFKLHPMMLPLYMISVNHTLTDPNGIWYSAGTVYKYGIYLQTDSLEQLLLPSLFYSWLITDASSYN